VGRLIEAARVDPEVQPAWPSAAPAARSRNDRLRNHPVHRWSVAGRRRPRNLPRISTPWPGADRLRGRARSHDPSCRCLPTLV